MEKYLVVDRIQDDYVVALNIFPDNIQFGTVLSFICTEGCDLNPKGNGNQRLESISLIIRGAQRDQKLSFIPRGYSAGIELSGKGISSIRKLLKEKKSNEQIILCG